MCDFHEPYFGATYPDATCIDGRLWDLDSDDGEGNLTSGGDDPCPVCNHDDWLEGAKDEFSERGWIAREDGKPREYEHSKLRWEQPGDAEKISAWWLEGWDERDREISSANTLISETQRKQPKDK